MDARVDLFIECKNPKGINFETIFIPGNPTHPVWAWWTNAKQQAEQEGKKPHLVFKWWRSQVWVLEPGSRGPLQALDSENEPVSFTLFHAWLDTTRWYVERLHKV
jgi:hypothetical protein